MFVPLLVSADNAIRTTIQQLPPGYWDFSRANTKEWTHGYHSYPAMMIPQVARTLIRIMRQHQPAVQTLFDPFMGSGTSLVEGLLQGLSVTGSDLNPLSRLIAKAKTTAYDPEQIREIRADMMQYARDLAITEADWPNFAHLTFWFKPAVITELTRLKRAIEAVVPESLRPFFWVAFSDTVRWVSNSRNAEFKLYRLDARRLATWNPNVMATFERVLTRNQLGNESLWKRRPLPSVALHGYSAMDLSAMPTASFDLMVTSPPYGDSRTTVAYGQFSRLSLQWLDLADAESPPPTQLDQAMLGGRAASDLDHALPSSVLMQALAQIAVKDANRAREVLAFYQDLDQTLAEISRVMRRGGYQCWVVGNRTVKEVQLLTDKIIDQLSERHGLVPVVNFTRAIPNKRMPKENSPTNQVGKKVTTMNGEQIVILRKE